MLIIGLKRCTSLYLVDADPIGVTLHRPLCLSIASSYRIVNRCRRIVKCLWSLASQLLYLLLILRGHKVCGMLRETCWRSVLTVCSIADSHIVWDKEGIYFSEGLATCRLVLRLSVRPLLCFCLSCLRWGHWVFLLVQAQCDLVSNCFSISLLIVDLAHDCLQKVLRTRVWFQIILSLSLRFFESLLKIAFMWSDLRSTSLSQIYMQSLCCARSIYRSLLLCTFRRVQLLMNLFGTTSF